MGSLRSLRRNYVEQEPVTGSAPSDQLLIEAVQFGTVKLVETLLKEGANPNATDGNLESALGIAVLRDQVGKTRLLVQYGADLDQRNAHGFTALHLAESSEICEFLLDHGADVNASGTGGWTPLMMAVADDEFEIAKLLLARGADATLRNHRGKRALDLLERGRESESLRKLLKRVS